MTPRRKDIAQLLAARCAVASQVTNVIGLRIRPDVLEPDETLPAATYEVVASDHWHHLLGAAGEAQTRVQFSIYALTRETAERAAYAIRDVLDGYTGTLTHDDVDYAFVSDCIIDNWYTRREPDAPGSNRWRYRTVIDFEVSHTEPVPSLTLE